MGAICCSPADPIVAPAPGESPVGGTLWAICGKEPPNPTTIGNDEHIQAEEMSEPVERAVAHALTRAKNQFGVSIPEGGQKALAVYANELVRWNRTINLTSIVEPEAVAELHLLDSLAVVPHLAHGVSVLDVGTGGGLPGIPLAIARPDCTFWLVDRTEKKILFLKNVVARLGLKNVHPTHARLEGNPFVEQIGEVDVAVSRAFTSAPEWIELARPYVRPGGRIVCMLGADDPEPDRLQRSLDGGRIVLQQRYSLPSGAKRGLLIVDKSVG